MTTLTAGDKAPDFEGTLENGEKVKLGDYAGKNLILYFYPKDDTPGCTKQGCNLRDNYSELKKQGFEILGVSPDKPAKHQKFIDKYSFPFSLIADEDHTIIKSYGVWGPKKFMGREYEGLLRTTFVIDETGNIKLVIPKVKTGDHSAQILAELEKVS
jgi:peroxiredoxin Q/BCP